jgi:Flp pilus assembly protein TadG
MMRLAASHRWRPLRRRRAIVTLWTLLCVPVLILVLLGVAEVNRLGQARVQLENALESAALAAVQEWGEQGGGSKTIAAARAQGRAYALANTVQGVALDLDNRQSVPAVQWSFGCATRCGRAYQFQEDPEAKTHLVVVLGATARVAPLSRQVLPAGTSGGTVRAAVAAYYDPHRPHELPKLIRLN